MEKLGGQEATPSQATMYVERTLLSLGGVFMLVNLLTLALVRGFRLADGMLLVGWVAVGALSH